ncbi:MAG TPA: hypothetical protein VFV57_05915 [Limnobacter sp.]|nr:hypothetical protein [Limnobacter sp.]
MILTIVPFHVAVQGAGFRLNPLTTAIQGFLYPKEDEPGNVFGSGGKFAKGGKTRAKYRNIAQAQPSTPNDDAALIQQVIDKYDYLEGLKQVRALLDQAKEQAILDDPAPEQPAALEETPEIDISLADVDLGAIAMPGVLLPQKQALLDLPANLSAPPAIPTNQDADMEVLALLMLLDD